MSHAKHKQQTQTDQARVRTEAELESRLTILIQ